MRARVKRLGLVALTFVVGGCQVRQMIYPAPPVPVGEPPPPLVERTFDVDQSGPAVAWVLDAVPEKSAPTVLFFHGNGENLQTVAMAGTFDRFERCGVNVVGIDYPGYGRSAGTPSERALERSARAALSLVHDRFPQRPVVACGWSLGAAVAIRLAAEESDRVHGLIALSPWTSMPEVAAKHFPSWMVKLLLHESYDSMAAAASVTVPSLIVHGRRDSIIPASQGRRLAAALGGEAQWLEVPGAGHNDLLARPEVWQGIASYLNRGFPPRAKGRGSGSL